jgi:hypothetical protein
MPRPLPPTPARSLRVAALGLALATALAPSPARAQDDDAPPAEGDPLRPATPVQLRVEPTDGALWKLTLTNRSDATWRVAADARLLTVELIGAPLPDLVARKQKGGAKPRSFPRAKLTRCQMPAGMRPPGIVPSRALVLHPGESYVELVHPVALCGAAAIVDALRPGAIVYPSFGTPEKRKKNAPPRPLPPPPYVAEPLREQEGVQPLRWIEATPFVLPARDERPPGELAAAPEAPHATTTPPTAPGAGPSASPSPAHTSTGTPSPDSPSAPANAPPPPPEPDDYAPRLTLDAPARADAANARNALLSATLRNAGKTPVSMRLRPDALVFRVKLVGPAHGPEAECGFANARRASVRDFFSTLGAGKTRSLSALLGELCPGEVLSRPGVYEVWPRVELHENGERFDIAAVTGTFAARSPTLLRLRSGAQPYHDQPPQVFNPEGDAPRPPPPDPNAPPPAGKAPEAPAREPTPPRPPAPPKGPPPATPTR